MVAVVSKLLLLVALFSGIENAVAREENNNRELSLERLPRSIPRPPLEDVIEESVDKSFTKSNKSRKSVEESEDESPFKSYKSLKVAKSGSDTSGNKSDKSDGDKSGTKSDKSDSEKGSKSQKKGIPLHIDGDLTVEYAVVEHFESKSSKSRPKIPDFEFIEAGYKSWKSSKNYENDVAKSAKYDKDGSGGLKSAKYEKEESDGVKDAKYDKNGSGGVKSTKDGSSKSMKGEARQAPAPTMMPDSPPPTEEGTFGIGVPLYSLVYKLTSKKEPTTEELNQLKEATRTYIDDFFIDEFEEDDFTIYSQYIADIEGFTASSDSQVVVSYDSIVRIGQLSLIKPMPEQLGSAIAEAFTGLEMIKYEDWLNKMLPTDNIFVGSKVHYYNGDGVPDTSRIGVAGIAASAAAMTLLVAGVILYKSKSDNSESETDKLTKSPGDMTVAGETFAGETYDGTGSVSATSVDYVRRMDEEEDGTKEGNLGLIPETDDADSMNPTWNDDEKIAHKGGIFRLAPKKLFSAFRSSVKSAPRTSSFEDVALQAPTYGDRFQDNIMPDPSSSEDDESQMSDSELSQFVANQTAGRHMLEIKSILSQDSMDENTAGDLSVRDNSSRRLRTVAEIEALLSSELKDDNSGSGSRTSRSIIRAQLETGRPRTVEEIESLLTAEDDDSIVELPGSDEDASIEEC